MREDVPLGPCKRIVRDARAQAIVAGRWFRLESNAQDTGHKRAHEVAGDGVDQIGGERCSVKRTATRLEVAFRLPRAERFVE